MAALPCPRASTAGESALAAEAWLLSGEEVRFSTRRILPAGGPRLERATQSTLVRFTAGVEGATRPRLLGNVHVRAGGTARGHKRTSGVSL